MKILLKILTVILSIIIVLALAFGAFLFVSAVYRSNPDNVEVYNTTNPYITENCDVIAHRSGAGIVPEQTMMAFKYCVENLSIDTFEFDLHITKDKTLVLLHDNTLDRVSDSEKVFGKAGVLAEEKTYEELRELNMGAKFVDENGEMPYADSNDEDLKIQSLDNVLDYLTSSGDFNYIIEVKNGGEIGKESVDILYKTLVERNLLHKVIFGTFHKEITEYADLNYPDMMRSTSMGEVIDFYIAAMTSSETYKPPCKVLQIPFCSWEDSYGINFGVTKVINYAHKHDMAVQYWTINEKEDMEYLISIGADGIMTDYPDKLNDAMQK